jgi:hypothetical protein
VKWFEPTVQPAVSVDANTIIAVPIHPNYREKRIERVLIIPLSGSATLSAPVLSTDPACAARQRQIAAWVNATAADPVDDDNGGNGFAWDPSTSDGNLYVKPAPNAGADNSYRILIGIGGRP